MPGWLKDLLAGLAAVFAYFTGRKAGEEAAQQADQAAALKQDDEVEHAVNQAQASAPVDRRGVSDELRSGDF